MAAPATPDAAVLLAAHRRCHRDGSAIALAPSDGVTDPYQWLMNGGYELVPLGITAEMARSWVPREIGGITAIGVALSGGGVLVVDRRRPS